MMSIDQHAAPITNDLVEERNRTILASVGDVLTTHVTGHSVAMGEMSAEVTSLTAAIVDMLGRGKRIRAQFCMWGSYGATGGELVEGVPEIAAAIELFHLAALVHDDLMDSSDTRRGLPTVHRQFAAGHTREQRLGDADNHGSAAAILVGDMLLSWSDDLAAMSTDSLDSRTRRTVRAMWSRMRDEAYAGQYLDMLSQTEVSTSRRRTDLILELKSAKYTISHPLRLGAAIAGGDDELLHLYDQIGLTAGAAFQLRDDLLGVFGDPQVTGKPAVDDIREGKRTLLMAVAESRAGDSQKQVLRHALGNPAVGDADLEAVRSVLTDTGADEAVEDRIRELTDNAMEILEYLPVDELTRTALTGLIERCVWRRS
ncbi:polyprenyl synthetase family protein [Gordonia rubripertincta]|uniref:Polyprenyl synthetase family protein n=1 Tax=Gordonia rubripertincta TaxID=36822 RepID=A0ABT4MZU2_GORRU|nr:polyprenyl synthetase family protein [Gordonia rubripertincta]MCZ4552529.1 polyprenyl synthetase family protein [Gordonia rubripertincta]